MEVKNILYILIFVVSFSSFGAPSNLFEGKTAIEEPFGIRDPFKSPSLRVERQSKVVGKVGAGKYSNIPVLGDVEVDDIIVVGVLIGKDRRAFVRLRETEGAAGGTTYTVKEGERIGENDAELKAILPGGLVLVEKTVNIYGQEEYLETVVPISK